MNDDIGMLPEESLESLFESWPEGAKHMSINNCNFTKTNMMTNFSNCSNVTINFNVDAKVLKEFLNSGGSFEK